MCDESTLLNLTQNDVKKIDNWISDNNFSLATGHFELIYEFGPLEESVMLLFCCMDKTYSLDVYDDWRREERAKTVDKFEISGHEISLKLAVDSLEKYFQESRTRTEMEMAGGIEPTGCGLRLVVSSDGASIFAGAKSI